MGRFFGSWIKKGKRVPDKLGGFEGRGSCNVAISGGGARWSSLSKIGGGGRELCGWFHPLQACAAEGGVETSSSNEGFEETSRQRGSTGDSFSKHCRG